MPSLGSAVPSLGASVRWRVRGVPRLGERVSQRGRWRHTLDDRLRVVGGAIPALDASP